MQIRKGVALVAALAGAGVLLAPGHRAATPRATATDPKTSAQLAGIPFGRTRVVDMTYAINGKLPAWPGDDRTFEAQVVATPGKDGYFARSFWTLEHYGTHLDAPTHFPPGKQSVDQIPVSH
jgi:hypothetical protein